MGLARPLRAPYKALRAVAASAAKCTAATRRLRALSGPQGHPRSIKATWDSHGPYEALKGAL